MKKLIVIAMLAMIVVTLLGASAIAGSGDENRQDLGDDQYDEHSYGSGEPADDGMDRTEKRASWN